MVAAAQGFVRKQTNKPNSGLDSRGLGPYFIKRTGSVDLVIDPLQNEVLFLHPRRTGLPQFHLGVCCLLLFLKHMLSVHQLAMEVLLPGSVPGVSLTHLWVLTASVFQKPPFKAL